MSLKESVRKAGIGKVVAVYASASFVILQAVDLFQPRLHLPEWLFTGVLALLIVGLPVFILTAIVQAHEFESQLIERSFTWRRSIGGGLAAISILTTVAGFYARDRFGGEEAIDANLVAVFPFRVSGANPSLHYLKEGMVDLLAAKLSGEGGARAADPRVALAAWRRIDQEDPDTEQLVRAARNIGARRILIGEVVGNEAQLTINASVTDTRTGRKVQHAVTGPLDSLPKRVDELSAVLLSLDAGEPRDRIASLTSTSLDALRSYLLGTNALRQANGAAAGKHFSDALTADSTFALAGLGLVAAGMWSQEITFAMLERGQRLAWSNRERLPELDRLRLNAFVGATYPTPQGDVEKCAYWQQIIDRAPEHAEAWHNLGDCIYHFWAYTPVANHVVKAKHAFRRSLALDSTFMPNLEHLIRIAVDERDTAAVKQHTARFLAADTANEITPYVRWLHDYATGVPHKRLLAQADSLEYELTTYGLHVVENGTLADSIIMLETRFQMGAGQVLNYQALGRHALVAKGVEAANADLRTSGDAVAVIHALYSDYDTIAAKRHVAELDRFAAEPAPTDEYLHEAWSVAACVSEQWRLWRGDASRTDATLAKVEDGLCRAMLQAIRATLDARSDALALTARVDSISATAPLHSWHHRYIRLVASRLFERHGDIARARTAVNRFNIGVYAAHDEAQWLQSARLSVKLGDRDTAIRNYQKFLSLRGHADGVGAVTTRQVRQELEALVAARN